MHTWIIVILLWVLCGLFTQMHCIPLVTLISIGTVSWIYLTVPSVYVRSIYSFLHFHSSSSIPQLISFQAVSWCLGGLVWLEWLFDLGHVWIWIVSLLLGGFIYPWPFLGPASRKSWLTVHSHVWQPRKRQFEKQQTNFQIYKTHISCDWWTAVCHVVCMPEAWMW